MSLRRKLRLIGESALIGLAAVAIPPLPRRGVVWLAQALGTAAYALARRERRIGLANAALVFGEALDERQRARIVRESFRTFALVLLDLFWFRFRSRRRVERYVTLSASWEHWLRAQPCVAVTGHFGNWEVMGLAAALHGAPPLSVAADFDNPVVRRMLDDARKRTGQTVATREGAVRALLKELRRGGRVALLMDQNTLPEEGGQFVPFFGRMVPVSTSAAVLWKRTGAAIMQGLCTSDRRGQYTLHVTPLVAAEEQSISEEEITRRVAAAMERAIREQPGQWLWMYKRWKFVPPGEDRAAYPFYARPWTPPEKTAGEPGKQGVAGGTGVEAAAAKERT